jgi:hypothetical protein
MTCYNSEDFSGQTEGRRKKEEGRRKKEEGRRKKEEGRSSRLKMFDQLKSPRFTTPCLIFNF